MTNSSINHIPVGELGQALGFDTTDPGVEPARSRDLADFKMAEDDAPILRYVFRSFRPARHLEFGTWRGEGTLCCLEECDATVWTINLPEGEGEEGVDGEWAYPVGVKVPGWQARFLRLMKRIEHTWLPASIRGIPWRVVGRHVQAKSDALGNVGWAYLQKGLGSRVCQVYCDSTAWDTRAYPDGFFDSVLIDGGHSKEVVISDTRKSLPLLRSGGIILWHDYCPEATVRDKCGSTQGVFEAIDEILPWLLEQTSQLAWIDPSWLLVGVKR